jgi:hypothetical protein
VQVAAEDADLAVPALEGMRPLTLASRSTLSPNGVASTRSCSCTPSKSSAPADRRAGDQGHAQTFDPHLAAAYRRLAAGDEQGLLCTSNATETPPQGGEGGDALGPQLLPRRSDQRAEAGERHLAERPVTLPAGLVKSRRGTVTAPELVTPARGPVEGARERRRAADRRSHDSGER